MGVTNVDTSNFTGSYAVSDSYSSDIAAIAGDTENLQYKFNRIFKLIVAIAIILLITVIGLSSVLISLSSKFNMLNEHVIALNQQSADQQNQIEAVSDSIDAVKIDIDNKLQSQQAQIDETRQIQRATNKALIRFIRKSNLTEEELREELKKD